MLDDKEIPRSTRQFIKCFEQVKAERSKLLPKSASVPTRKTYTNVPFLRATQSFPPQDTYYLQSNDEILYQSWNSRKIYIGCFLNIGTAATNETLYIPSISSSKMCQQESTKKIGNTYT